MNHDDDKREPRHQKRLSAVFYRSLRRRFRELPISFYLILAIIVALLLGVTGFAHMGDPRRMAFTLTLFVVFFGAITYRALIDAVDIYRDYHRERRSLLSNVLERDGFAGQLREKTKAHAQSDASKSDA